MHRVFFDRFHDTRIGEFTVHQFEATSLLVLHEQHLKSEHGVENIAEDNRRARRRTDLSAQAALAGRTVTPLLLSLRAATQRSVKSIRWLRHAIRDGLAEGVDVPRLRRLYATL